MGQTWNCIKKFALELLWSHYNSKEDLRLQLYLDYVEITKCICGLSILEAGNLLRVSCRIISIVCRNVQ